MGRQVRDSLHPHKDLPHFAQLLLGLLSCNMMYSKATLGVLRQTEILASLINADDFHKINRVDYISSDLAISLNKTLRTDLLSFLSW